MVSSPKPATSIPHTAAGSMPEFPAKKWYARLIGGAPKSGITIAFIRNLNATPNAIPPATVRIQLLGRTYPISRQGVRDNRAQTSTNAAPTGRMIISPPAYHVPSSARKKRCPAIVSQVRRPPFLRDNHSCEERRHNGETRWQSCGDHRRQQRNLPGDGA